MVVSHFGHWLQQMLEQMEENAEDECSIKISTKVHQEQHYFFFLGNAKDVALWIIYGACLGSVYSLPEVRPE